ncbi:hypothetical protein T439DRAFT_325229 [Meredithblackwellia eburnea MCA 4105]
MNSIKPPSIKVGVGVFIQRSSDSSFIVGIRKGSHGAGTIQLIGGHLEFGETLAECARRETLEETGITIPGGEEAFKFISATNDVFVDLESGETKHYVTMFVLARAPEGVEPQVTEPEKCERWEWTTWSSLKSLLVASSVSPSPSNPEIFLPLKNLLLHRPDIRI